MKSFKQHLKEIAEAWIKAFLICVTVFIIMLIRYINDPSTVCDRLTEKQCEHLLETGEVLPAEGSTLLRNGFDKLTKEE